MLNINDLLLFYNYKYLTKLFLFVCFNVNNCLKILFIILQYFSNIYKRFKFMLKQNKVYIKVIKN